MLETKESLKAKYLSSKEGIIECLDKVKKKHLRKWISFLYTSVYYFNYYMRLVIQFILFIDEIFALSFDSFKLGRIPGALRNRFSKCCLIIFFSIFNFFDIA